MSAATERARANMVAGLLRPGCHVCEAMPGEWCDPSYPEHDAPAEMCRVDRYPPHLVHSVRLLAAVAGGHVRRRLLVAQFAGGPLPAVLAA